MSRVFYPLGFPVRIATRSCEVIEAATASWGSCRQLFGTEPIVFAVRVTQGPAVSSSDFAYRAGMIEFVGDATNRGWFSPLHRRGSLRVTKATCADTDVFRYRFLEAIVMTALDTVAFTPVHAGCVAQGNAGLLLCGDSGAGKSSLTYAGGKAGWSIVSDDAAHLVRGGRGALVGDPRRISLREPARFLFPELSRLPAKLQPNDKTAIEVDSARAFLVSETAMARRAVFLVRRHGPARLRPFSREDALAYFRRYVPWRTDAGAQDDLQAAIADGCWRLDYNSLEGAVAALRSLIQASAA